MRKLNFGAIGWVVFGVTLIIGSSWFVYTAAGNSLDELALIRRAQIAAGSLVDTWEEEVVPERGPVGFLDVGVYTYRLSDGREFEITTSVPRGELKKYEEVEYLPDNPAVSRLKGSGCQSVFEWLWRKVALGGALLAVFVGFVAMFIRAALRGSKRSESELLRDLNRSEGELPLYIAIPSGVIVLVIALYLIIVGTRWVISLF